jgi:hypothetical protein
MQIQFSDHMGSHPAGASGLDVFDEANAVTDKIVEVAQNWKRKNLFLTIND